MEGLRDARKQMEVQTENSILEKLEAQRMEDEKKRFREFDSLNFSLYTFEMVFLLEFCGYTRKATVFSCQLPITFLYLDRSTSFLIGFVVRFWSVLLLLRNKQ
ncbi:hypothetical protein B9G79_08535 [Bdellovibrio bacteriovorus]|uniref:Uncharacterized protein n=2 Tax=Bdellovibrio bacteriovorus TaxID=959 RepID=A0A1Z3N846_BDEBC|nr:hypothetical protein B9G79_08535 [Bdellovibrio bacteriovorus]